MQSTPLSHAALHLARISAPGNRPDALIYQFGLYPWRYSHAFLESRMADPGSVWERAIPFVSYMGLHASWTHLVINSLWLLAFGPIVARRYGNTLFLAFFLLCGVVAAMTYLALNWGDSLSVIGASGAISGVLGAYILLFPRRGVHIWLFLFIMTVPAFIAVGLWFLFQVLNGLGTLGGQEAGGVAYAAHIGGFIFGLLLVRRFVKRPPLPRRRW